MKVFRELRINPGQEKRGKEKNNIYGIAQTKIMCTPHMFLWHMEGNKSYLNCDLMTMCCD